MLQEYLQHNSFNGNAIDLDRHILRDEDDPIISRHHDKINLSEWTARMLEAQADIIRIA